MCIGVLSLFFGHSMQQLGVGSPFQDQGLNPGPQQWKHQILTTRPPGTSPGVVSSSFAMVHTPAMNILPHAFQWMCRHFCRVDMQEWNMGFCGFSRFEQSIFQSALHSQRQCPKENFSCPSLLLVLSLDRYWPCCGFHSHLPSDQGSWPLVHVLTIWNLLGSPCSNLSLFLENLDRWPFYWFVSSLYILGISSLSKHAVQRPSPTLRHAFSLSVVSFDEKMFNFPKVFFLCLFPLDSLWF